MLTNLSNYGTFMLPVSKRIVQINVTESIPMTFGVSVLVIDAAL